MESDHPNGESGVSRRTVLRMLAASAAAGRTPPLLPATGAAPALPKKGGILRYDLSIDPPHLDPHVDSGDAFSLVKGTIYSLMVRLNEKMEIVPDLAESWERPDNLTCVFRLRKNVKWHHESNFTSADVKASMEQILDPKIGAWAGGDLKNVQRVETPDDETFRSILRPPDAAFLPTLTFANSLITSKALIERGADLRNQIIGTGPFKVAARRRRYGLYWALYPGNIRRAELLRFLQGLGCHLPQGFTLIWDRHRPHRAARVQAWLARRPRIVVEWFSACAPDLHPAEHIWAHTKHGDLANLSLNDLASLEAAVGASLARTFGAHELLAGFVQAAGLAL